jgi:hypothetical protein
MDTQSMKDRAQNMRDSAQRQAEERERETQRKMEILDLLESIEAPGTLDFVHGAGYRCDGLIRFVAETADIPGLLAAFPPVPVGKYKGSSTSFYPLSEARAKDPDPIPVAPFLVQVGKVADYPFTVTVEWWAKLGGLLINIEIKVSDGHTWATLRDDPERGYRGKLIRHRWICKIEKSQDLFVKWWAEHDKPSDHTFYWTDPDQRWEDL